MSTERKKRYVLQQAQMIQVVDLLRDAEIGYVASKHTDVTFAAFATEKLGYYVDQDQVGRLRRSLNISSPQELQRIKNRELRVEREQKRAERAAAKAQGVEVERQPVFKLSVISDINEKIDTLQRDTSKIDGVSKDAVRDVRALNHRLGEMERENMQLRADNKERAGQIAKLSDDIKRLNDRLTLMDKHATQAAQVNVDHFARLEQRIAFVTSQRGSILTNTPPNGAHG